MGIGILLGFTAMFMAFGAQRMFSMRRRMRQEEEWFSSKEQGGSRQERGSLEFEADGGVPRPPSPGGIDPPT